MMTPKALAGELGWSDRTLWRWLAALKRHRGYSGRLLYLPAEDVALLRLVRSLGGGPAQMPTIARHYSAQLSRCGS